MSAPRPTLVPKEDRKSWLPLLQVAAQEVFDLMLGSKLRVPAGPVQDVPLDTTAMVGLAGQLCGVMTVRCTAKSARKMAAKMLGTDSPNGGQEMWDAMGEICNMVAGNFKNKIDGLGDGCMLSVPTVITGADYNVHSMADDDALRTTLLFDDEYLIVCLQIHS